MRKILIISAALLTLASAAGCGGDEAPAATPPPEPTSAPDLSIAVTVETTDGLIGHNHDDEVCIFAEPEYELRDGEGTIIDVGRWEEDGASVGPSGWAITGSVGGLAPDYLCTFTETLVAPPADIYTLKVTALQADLLGDGSEVSAEATFERGATTTSVKVELES